MISHVSKKQSTQALSSTEAEYMAIASALQEGLWLRTFFQLLGISFPTPIHLYICNGRILYLFILSYCVHLSYLIMALVLSSPYLWLWLSQ